MRIKRFKYEEFLIFIEKNKVYKLYRNVRYSTYRFFWIVRRLIKLVPIVKDTYDFDSVYAVKMFTFQLKNLADFLDSDKSVTVDASYHAGRIRTAIKILERVCDGYYEMKPWCEVEKQHGTRNFEFVSIPETECYEMKWTYPEGANSKEMDKAYFKAAKDGKLLEEKANRIAWKIIQRYVWQWWS